MAEAATNLHDAIEASFEKKTAEKARKKVATRASDPEFGERMDGLLERSKEDRGWFRSLAPEMQYQVEAWAEHRSKEGGN